MNTSSKKKKVNRTKRFIYFFLGFLILLNLLIITSGKSYLYKGLKETYFKGKTGPGIYDSLVFENRFVKAGDQSVPLLVSESASALTNEEKEFLASIQTTSFLILKNNELIIEHYWDEHTKNTKSNSFSMAKSIVGLLVGIAVDNGHISSFDAPIANYVDFFENGDQVTIRNLLTMSSDLNWRESGSNPFSENAAAYYGRNLEKLISRLTFGNKVNDYFHYASGNSQILGFILQKATKMRLSEYLQEQIWDKIGAENDAFWSLDSKGGMEKTFCCLYASTRDFAKIGQLILNQGKLNEKTIVSETTLNELVQPALLNDGSNNIRYGMHFWLTNYEGHDVVYLRGILGQYVIVVPDWDMVIVRTGHERMDKIERQEGVQKDYRFDHPEDLFYYLKIGKERFMQNLMNKGKGY